MRISDWSSDVCSSDLHTRHRTICHVSWFLLVTSWLPFVTQCSIVNQDDSPIRDKTSCQGSSSSICQYQILPPPCAAMTRSASRTNLASRTRRQPACYCPKRSALCC